MKKSEKDMEIQAWHLLLEDDAYRLDWPDDFYTVLIAAAQAAGDAETQAACEKILPQEIAMAQWLLEHLPELTQAFLERSAAPDTEAKR